MNVMHYKTFGLQSLLPVSLKTRQDLEITEEKLPGW